MPDIPDIGQQLQFRLRFERCHVTKFWSFSYLPRTGQSIVESRIATDEFRVNAHSVNDSKRTRLTPSVANCAADVGF